VISSTTRICSTTTESAWQTVIVNDQELANFNPPHSCIRFQMIAARLRASARAAYGCWQSTKTVITGIKGPAELGLCDECDGGESWYAPIVRPAN